MKLTIDTTPIRENARHLSDLAAGRGLGLAVVLKAGAARPEIAAALAAGGIRRFYLSGPHGMPGLNVVPRESRALVRLARWSELPDIPLHFGVSVQSDIAKIEALRQAAAAAGLTHRVLLAVDLGDRREGLLPDEVGAFAAAPAGQLNGPLALEGLLVNFACCTRFLPRAEHFRMISRMVQQVEAITGSRLGTVSIGGSVVLDHLTGTKKFGRVTEMRSGEALLLGTITNARRQLRGLDRNGFIFSGEILEAKTRPISTDGQRGLDAMNTQPRIGRHGLRHRLLADFGSLHTAVHGLEPLHKGLEIVTASGEYTVLDATALDPRPTVGDRIDFRPDYVALAAALLSPLVDVEVSTSVALTVGMDNGKPEPRRTPVRRSARLSHRQEKAKILA